MRTLDPEFRTLLDALLARAEAALGMDDLRVAVVLHGQPAGADPAAYTLSLACDRAPHLMRVLRSAFPARAASPFRVSMGRFGSLELENARVEHLQAALQRAAERGLGVLERRGHEP